VREQERERERERERESNPAVGGHVRPAVSGQWSTAVDFTLTVAA